MPLLFFILTDDNLNWYDLLPERTREVKKKMNQSKKSELPFRPKEHAEDYILSRILSGHYPPGSLLPGERILSEEMGVTRPTLRETLHRLAGEGWLLIRHGKPTLVNDYWKTGGLGLLNTMTRYGAYLPDTMIGHLLDARAAIMPKIALQAAIHGSDALLLFLSQAATIKDTATAFTRFDWELQKRFAGESGNPLSLMLLNSFESLFFTMGQIYFNDPKGRKASAAYYRRLAPALETSPEAVESLVRDEMVRARELWSEIEKPSVSQTKSAQGAI
jgi:GntR family negative regulator for fad regulon and positive regulator of fabA